MNTKQTINLFASILTFVFAVILTSVVYGVWHAKTQRELPAQEDFKTEIIALDSAYWFKDREYSRHFLMIARSQDSLPLRTRLSGYLQAAADTAFLKELAPGDSVKISYREQKFAKGTMFTEMYPWASYAEVWELKLKDSLGFQKTILNQNDARALIKAENTKIAKWAFWVLILGILAIIASGFWTFKSLNSKSK